ncbi:MAG: thiol peroxidase [Planctomycetia bacterium]|nr:thiol peroxidase [Planctomycetia bacterium]
MKERPGAVKMNGSPLTLVGEEVSIGDAAPNFTVLDGALEPVEFSSFAGKVCIISPVPSLDTPVCDLQTRRFNEEAAALRPGVVVLTISMDLPFAQKRWCASAGIENMRTLSDHRDASFGLAFGMLIKELRLLARGVFVVDGGGRVRYAQIVEELTEEPDYDAALQAVRKLT